VIISKKITRVHPAHLAKEAKYLENMIEQWRMAWESEKMKQYMANYGSTFHSDGKNRRQWKAYKSRLAAKYRKIRVDIDNLQILRSNGLIMVKFDQRYQTESFKSVGEKRLYLKQNSKEWKIVGEFFKDTEEKRAELKKAKLAALKKPKPKKVAKKKPEKERPRLSGLKEIKNFIYLWLNAWQKKDIKTYMTCYDRAFRSRGMGYKGWKRHRERLNRKYRSLRIEIGNLHIKQDSIGTARVRFKQKYRADDYRDHGLKNLLLVKRGENWRIREETWQPLRKKRGR
jgi:hypothetical protein